MFKKCKLTIQMIRGLINLADSKSEDGYILSFKESVNCARYIYTMNSFSYAIFSCFKNILYLQMSRILEYNSDIPIYIFDEDQIHLLEFSQQASDKTVEAILTDEERVIKKKFEHALKGEASFVFARFDMETLVIPTHHLDLFVACKSSINSCEKIDFDVFSMQKW